jgi:hypothetical protein
MKCSSYVLNVSFLASCYQLIPATSFLQPDGSDLTPLTTLARPVSLDSLWPVACYKYLAAKFLNKNAVQTGSDDEEQVSGEDNDDATNGSNTAEKPKRKSGNSAGGKLAAMRRRKATLK